MKLGHGGALPEDQLLCSSFCAPSTFLGEALSCCVEGGVKEFTVGFDTNQVLVENKVDFEPARPIVEPGSQLEPA